MTNFVGILPRCRFFDGLYLWLVRSIWGSVSYRFTEAKFEAASLVGMKRRIVFEAEPFLFRRAKDFPPENCKISSLFLLDQGLFQ